jgi:hypothetical protein
MYANQYGVYHQGMHEICSYVMLAIEIDTFEQESLPQDGFDDLVNSQSLLCDTFVMFEAIMSPLRKCYEESARMSNSVVTKIPYVACNKDLYNHVQAVPMPHEVYCAKWIRLMFSREVDSWSKVFSLWDTFFDLTTQEPSITSSMGTTQHPLLVDKTPLNMGIWNEVLEMTGASLIWLKRKELRSHNTESAIETLLVGQPLSDATPLIDTLLSSLHHLQTNLYMAPIELPVGLPDIENQQEVTIPKTKKKRSGIALMLDKISWKGCSTNSSLDSRSDHATGGSSIESFLATQRYVSLQELVDASTDISLLLTSDSKDETDYCSLDDDDTYHSFAGSY